MDDRAQEIQFDISDAEIIRLIQEARDEALAQAKEILKARMIRSILERVGQERTRDVTGPTSGEATRPAGPSLSPGQPDVGAVPAQEPPPAGDAPTEVHQIQQEIASLRAKIAENDQLLNHIKAAPQEDQPETTVQAAPALEDAPEYGYYVYGISGSDHGQARDAQALTASLAGLPGMDAGHPVYVLPCRDLQAAVSEVPMSEFGEEALEANLGDVGWLERRARTHDQVIVELFVRCPLIPMRFCTIYRSEERVYEMMVQHHADFVATLERLAGTQEWGVKVYCNQQAMSLTMEQVSDEVKALTAEASKKSSGAAYFVQKRREAVLAQEMERICDECAQRCHDRLSAHAQEATINALQSHELSGRSEEMILNGAYLVAGERQPDFQGELEALEDEYRDLGISYVLTGPWPPYSFAGSGQ